jgi:hypothetical protein
MASGAFFTRIYLDTDDQISSEPTPSYRLLLDPGSSPKADCGITKTESSGLTGSGLSGTSARGLQPPKPAAGDLTGPAGAVLLHARDPASDG